MSEREFLEFKFLKLYTFLCYSCILYLYDFTDNHIFIIIIIFNTTVRYLQVHTSLYINLIQTEEREGEKERRREERRREERLYYN